MPRTSGLARVLFRPPRASSPAAGTGPFVVNATSSADPAVRAQAPGSLTIRPFADVSASVTPQNSQSSGVADHTVSVENRGNAAIRVSVSAQDPDNRLTCEAAPPEMTVDGGTVARSQLSVRTTNPKEARTGQRVGFQVHVRPAVGAPIKLDAATVLLQRPAGLWSKIRIPLAAALLLVVAGGVVAYAGPPYPHWPPLPNTPPTASPASATPTSAGPAFDNIVLSASALDWSQSPNGTKTVNLANTAKSGVAKIAQLQIVGDSSFVIDSLTQCRIGTILQPAQSCPVVIAFTPQAKGAHSASLSVQAVGSPPQTVALAFTPTPLSRMQLYAGSWVNDDPNTRDIVKVNIAVSGSVLSISPYGACSPNPCDWAALSAPPGPRQVTYTADPVVVVFVFSNGAPTHTLAIQLLNDAGTSLQVVIDQGRFTDTFHRA